MQHVDTNFEDGMVIFELERSLLIGLSKVFCDGLPGFRKSIEIRRTYKAHWDTLHFIGLHLTSYRFVGLHGTSSSLLALARLCQVTKTKYSQSKSSMRCFPMIEIFLHAMDDRF